MIKAKIKNLDLLMEESWRKELYDFFKGTHFTELHNFIRSEYQHKKIYPALENIFHAFSLTPFHNVRVVILGQDPYHGSGQAQGLSFSVPQGITVPPSLRNIYKEIESDIGITKDFENGNLESWAQQGVFLLNTILTVVADKPASHKKKGWEEFTDFVISHISANKEHVVFLLWGKFAQSKSLLIDHTKHLVLTAPHPSPFSVHSGFFGCKHFSQTNNYLRLNGLSAINW